MMVDVFEAVESERIYLHPVCWFWLVTGTVWHFNVFIRVGWDGGWTTIFFPYPSILSFKLQWPWWNSAFFVFSQHFRGQSHLALMRLWRAREHSWFCVYVQCEHLCCNRLLVVVHLAVKKRWWKGPKAHEGSWLSYILFATKFVWTGCSEMKLTSIQNGELFL